MAMKIPSPRRKTLCTDGPSRHKNSPKVDYQLGTVVPVANDRLQLQNALVQTVLRVWRGERRVFKHGFGGEKGQGRVLKHGHDAEVDFARVVPLAQTRQKTIINSGSFRMP